MNVLLYSTLGQPVSTRCIYHGGSLLSFPLILLFVSRHYPSAPSSLEHEQSASRQWASQNEKRLILLLSIARIQSGFVLRDLNWIVYPVHSKPGVRHYRSLKKRKKKNLKNPQPSQYTLWCRHNVQHNSKPRRIDCSGELITPCFIAFQQGKMKLLKFHLTRQPYELIVILGSVNIHRENNRLFFKWT